jgi:hypothetical protein
MRWEDLEKCFNRAFFLSFSKKKALLVFPMLVLCGILVVFCRALALDASGWIAMSLIFLPIFLSSGILLSLGVFLIRIYYHEVKGLKGRYREILKHSWQLIIGTSYLSIPPILIYLFLWVIFGIFVLLKEIPQIGPYIGVVLTFAPFLIILSSLLLAYVNLFLLFFVSPAVALRPVQKLHFDLGLIRKFKTSLFSNLLLFLIALFPTAMVVLLLSLAGLLTELHYLVAQQTLSLALQWFFIMLPFCACLTPAVVFFFNFAAESYNLIEIKRKES